jgi:beta-mannosidase
LHEFDFTAQLRQYGREKLVFVVELWQDAQCITRQVLAFAPERAMLWPDPGITVDVENDGNTLIITLSAHALARFVALWFSGADVIFSDNYFDLSGGRTVSVTCPMPQGWTVAQAFQALRVRSLADVRWTGTPMLNRLRGFSGVLNPTTLATWAASLFAR